MSKKRRIHFFGSVEIGYRPCRVSKCGLVWEATADAESRVVSDASLVTCAHCRVRMPSRALAEAAEKEGR